MPESESVVSRNSHSTASRTGIDDPAHRFNARAVPEREGLPQGYRMRADAHYVDQLESRQPVIRLLSIAQIECPDLPPADHVVALTKSIVVHGVLQPLLIRKEGGRYSIIAGRKRLSAATAAGLSVVPCLLHEIDGAAAEALATAENLRFEDADVPPVERTFVHPVLRALGSDLSTILTSTALLASGGLPRQVGAGLIETQAARAAWMVTAMLGPFQSTRRLPLAAIVQGVSDSFAAQANMSGLDLQCTVTPGAAIWKLPEDAATAALTGGVLAALSCQEGLAAPGVEIHADAAPGRSLKIEVVQRAAHVAASVGESLAHRDTIAPPALIPALALRLARQVAESCGGNADLAPLPVRGSVLQLTFPAPPAGL